VAFDGTNTRLRAGVALWTVYSGVGLEHRGRALELLKRFGSVTVLNGHIHQVMQKIEGNATFISRARPRFRNRRRGRYRRPDR
jgi:hypothetical protein